MHTEEKQGRIQEFGKGGGGGGGGGLLPLSAAMKFVTQSFCEFMTEACTWPCTSYMSVFKVKRLVYVLLY